MLYNESTGKSKVQTDVFSLAGLTAWLEKMPARATYCYADTGHCLLAQYFRSVGQQTSCLGNVTVMFCNDSRAYDIPQAFQKVAMGKPHRFDAALRRARKASGLQADR